MLKDRHVLVASIVVSLLMMQTTAQIMYAVVHQ
jgi:hypothetical protein